MSIGKRITLSLSLLLITNCLFLSSCSHGKQADRKSFEPPPIPQDSPVDLRPPQLTEVQEKIKMVFGQTVTIESGSSGSGQPFFAGDFNGDTWPDLAAVVKPAAGSLAELNHELANWALGDPTKTPTNPNEITKAPKTTIEQNDLLLAIVHGYGQAGWREPSARQAYLLKNAVGRDMKMQTLDETYKLAGKKIQLPQLLGDVVKQRLADEEGFLYYNGAKYIWHRFTPLP